jgi:T-complex protein 1 subunit theta
MNKMVINHLARLFVTSDAHTIINESDVHHPAAKMVAQAAKMQQNECGDNANYVLTLAGELMAQAAGLINMGLHPSEILIGYDKAAKKTYELLEGLTAERLENPKDKAQLIRAVKSVVGSKQYGQEDFLTDLIAEASIFCTPTNASKFNIDNVRIQKILGGGLHDSQVVRGVVVPRESQTSFHQKRDCKVAVFNTNIEMQQGETKGTVLMKNADDLLNYTKGEEDKFEGFIKKLAEAGVQVVVCQGSMSELAVHFFEKYSMMAIKIMSKWELKRIGRACGATPIVKLECPTPDEMGYCDEVTFQEISSTWCTVFRRDKEENKMATIVLRGATNAMLDDIERAIDNGVNAVKSLIRDNRLVAGAGATEVYIANEIQKYSKTQPGLDQYAIEKFGVSFEVIPRILAENAGFKADSILADMYAQVNKGSTVSGVDVTDGSVRNAVELGVLDSMESKSWAYKLAFDVCLTLLKVDQIIMSKPSGGPNAANARSAQRPAGYDD